MASIPTLEESCISTYLNYLEHESAAYVSLTQSESVILKSIAPKMMTMMKGHLSAKIGSNGVTSTAIRQRMLEIVLSEKFPSVISKRKGREKKVRVKHYLLPHCKRKKMDDMRLMFVMKLSIFCQIIITITKCDCVTTTITLWTGSSSVSLSVTTS